MAYLIENNQQYLLAKQIIETCSTLIGNCYSTIPSLNNDRDIADVQNLIDRVSDIKLGYWGLTIIYERGLQNIEKEEKYYVQDGVTLPEIAMAFYGRQELWQYIYYHNELTSDILTVGQELRIPIMPNLPETVLHQADIFIADLSNSIGIVSERITGK